MIKQYAVSFCLWAIFLVLGTVSAATNKPLCADSSNNFVGMAIDKDAYISVAGSPDDDGTTQTWELTQEDTVDPMKDGNRKPSGPQHSYSGKFLQVLPDSGRSYPERGNHLDHAKDLDGDSPYVAFDLKVTRDRQGTHILFVRWTGGDTVGGGDSLYVVMYKKNGGKKRTLVYGQETVKPTVVPIDAGMANYEGCCYDMVTHACPCYKDKPDNTTCADRSWIKKDDAKNYGVQCIVGGGAMTIIKKPQWYLYAGQEAGDVMDFDSEPWDATCEAEGSNTRDSGHDYPSWELDKGDYELRIYAREDGTALDAIYIAGPMGNAPALNMRYSEGDSTFCVQPAVSGATIGYAIGGVVILFLVYFSRTSVGSEIMGSVLSKPGEAVRYVYVEGT